jgi:hypothetical protein
MANLDIPLCVWLWKWPLLCWLDNSINRISGLLVPSKHWEWRTALDPNHLPILREASQALHSKYEGPNFYVGRQLYTQNKAHNISQRTEKNFASEIWRSFHHASNMCQDDLNTSLERWKYSKHNPFTQNTSQKRTHNICNLSQRSPANHQQCNIPQAEFTV